MVHFWFLLLVASQALAIESEVFKSKQNIDEFSINYPNKTFLLYNTFKKDAATTKLRISLPDSQFVTPSEPSEQSKTDLWKFELVDGSRIEISLRHSFTVVHMNEFHIQWFDSEKGDTKREICFHYGDSNWYGLLGRLSTIN